MDQLSAAYSKGWIMNNQSIAISGSGLVEGSLKRRFVPRLDNKYEQALYEKIEKKTGIKYWNINQFDKDSQGTHLDAVSQAFEQAMKHAGLYRKINKKTSSRIGVIYFNMYGPTSFMNKEFQVKEMHQSDVFPAFLLNAHNISGYCIRLRSERNAVFQGLELASTLIESGELDVVVVGGVFQSYSYLYLTEMLAILDWQTKHGVKIKKTNDDYAMTESAGFVVVESVKANDKRQEKLKLNIDFLQSYSTRNCSELLNSPSLNDERLSQYPVDTCFQGLTGRSDVTQVEKMLFKDLYPHAKQENTYEKWGDFVNMNSIKLLHEKMAQDDQSSGLIHSIDRDGTAWNLTFSHNHKNRK